MHMRAMLAGSRRTEVCETPCVGRRGGGGEGLMIMTQSLRRGGGGGGVGVEDLWSDLF